MDREANREANRESVRLIWAGIMVGLLALSAVLAAGLRPPAVSGTPGLASAAAGPAVGRGEEASEAAAPVFAEDPEPPRSTEAAIEDTEPPRNTEAAIEDTEPSRNTEAAIEDTEPPRITEAPAGETEPSRNTEAPAGEAATTGEAGPFLVALRIPDPVTGERLFLCGEDGCPLEGILPDADGDAVLGPLKPGRYGVFRGDAEVGAFRLGDNAALTGAEGRLWTDGELLWLERWVCGALRLELSLPRPGYYSFQLWDENGRKRTADLYIPEETAPDREGRWSRALEFPGLAPGLYTLSRRGTPLLQIRVRAAETAAADLTVGK